MGMKRLKQRQGLVYLDPEKLQRQMLRRGLTRTSLADAAGISRNSILRPLRGEGIFASTAARIAKEVGIDDVADLLPSMDRNESLTGVNATPVSGEWEIDDYLGPWITASNELQFRICRLRHCFIEGRVGRGKWYDLLDPRPESGRTSGSSCCVIQRSANESAGIRTWPRTSAPHRA